MMPLLKYMDKTKTPFGRRMFRRWLLNPLRNPRLLKERLMAVGDLLKCFDDAVEFFQNEVHQLPDIEKMINMAYNSGSRKILSPFEIEEKAQSKLKYFLDVLKVLEGIESIINHMGDFSESFNSPRLKQLVTVRTHGNSASEKK